MRLRVARLRSRSWSRSRGRDERGMVTAFVTIFAMTLLFVAGLVFEGGRILTAKRETLNIAESAARAGAQALDRDQIEAHAVDILDHGAAVQAACNFLTQTGRTCGTDATVSTAPNRVTVTLTDHIDPVMLPPGAGRLSFTLSGTACVAYGVTSADATTTC